MRRRIFDVVVAGCAMAATLPLMLIAAIGVKASSPGPILYRARRMARDRRRVVTDGGSPCHPVERRREGYHGREFTLYKFRTMRVATGVEGPITAQSDSRVFPFGAFLRATKIDELPQLLNVIRGDMALVGPRPEAPEIVRSFYTADDLLTLQVQPGVTSPGSLYYYTHCEASLGHGDVTQRYVERLLPLKLALDRVYIGRSTLIYDIRVILRTVAVIGGRTLGIRRFPDPPELPEARMKCALFSTDDRTPIFQPANSSTSATPGTRRT
jgi:lipopolysaccharide/colanic/teichoic acid biosynthesis glycosyltransferase